MAEQDPGLRPSPNSEQRTFRGMTFDEFKALSDDEVAELKKKFEDSLSGMDPEDQAKVIKGWVDAATLHQFQSWRRHGKPDVDYSDEELAEFVSDYVARQKELNPNFGEMPETFNNLDRDARRHLAAILNYLFHMRSLTEQPYIDNYSLFHTVETNEEILLELKNRGILFVAADFRYAYPTPRYHEFWLAHHPELQNPEQDI